MAICHGSAAAPVNAHYRSILETLPCLSGIADGAREALIRSATASTYHDKEPIIMQGDPADHLFIVLSGIVRLSYIFEDGTQAFLGLLQSGECLGELGVCESDVYAETATAAGETCLARISARAFQNCFPDPADRNRELAGLLAARYRNYLSITCDLSFASLAERLARVMLKLSKCLHSSIDIEGREYECLSPMITQSDLGAMARGTRTNVNRTLKDWERSGWVLLRDRSIIILDRAGLESVARLH